MYSSSTKSTLHFGLLLLRIGFGIVFMVHGAPKMFGGPETWTEIGSATKYIGIEFAPMFFGFMAAFAEFFGGILLILGLFFTPALVLLIATMLVATFFHIGQGDPFSDISHPLENILVFISLLFVGPGKYSVDKYMK